MERGRFDEVLVGACIKVFDFANRIREGVAALTNGEMMAIYDVPEGLDSNGAGRVIKRSPLKGTITVEDFRSKQTLEFPATKIKSPQIG